MFSFSFYSIAFIANPQGWQEVLGSSPPGYISSLEHSEVLITLIETRDQEKSKYTLSLHITFDLTC